MSEQGRYVNSKFAFSSEGFVPQRSSGDDLSEELQLHLQNEIEKKVKAGNGCRRSR
ncbi:MAG TPA: hypothetical protein VFS12_19260 [Terriglobia bacterium]|nr:hypothetical protein [Terriglobia bacterium]